MSTLTDIKWNAKLYDDKHAFVFKYGEDLVDMLAPRPGERILDLGCGTGYLSDLIARSGALVTGIDNSEAMIAKAKEAYPEGDFRVMAATAIAFDQPFDGLSTTRLTTRLTCQLTARSTTSLTTRLTCQWTARLTTSLIARLTTL
jgi:ubiquinone/menaquinone biosynthesis C-methylase UbiE